MSQTKTNTGDGKTNRNNTPEESDGTKEALAAKVALVREITGIAQSLNLRLKGENERWLSSQAHNYRMFSSN